MEQTYFRWRKEYGGLRVDQAKLLKKLEQENAKLQRLVANLSLDNLVRRETSKPIPHPSNEVPRTPSDDASRWIMRNSSMR